MPDAALVAPCDRTDAEIATNVQLANGYVRRGRQRDDCADRMDGVRRWREDALKRNADARRKEEAGNP